MKSLSTTSHDVLLLIVTYGNQWQIDDLEGAKRAGELFGYPLMIKSRRLAYDGRGNAVAKSEEELTSAVTGNSLFLVFCCHYYSLLMCCCRI